MSEIRKVVLQSVDGKISQRSQNKMLKLWSGCFIPVVFSIVWRCVYRGCRYCPKDSTPTEVTVVSRWCHSDDNSLSFLDHVI